MPHGFIALAYSFCAAMGIEGNQDVIKLGYISNGECIVQMMLGGSKGPEDTITIGDHEVAIEMIDGGAVVHIDDLQFVVQKTEEI